MVAHLDESLSYARNPASTAVSNLLLGTELDVEIPALAELTAATAALAIGSRRKALLPLASAAVEYALLRRGDTVMVSCYGTSSAPVVYQLDRKVSLRRLLDTCAQAMVDEAGSEHDATARQIAMRVAERALSTKIAPDPDGRVTPMNQRGGDLDSPGEDVPLAFGYEAAIFPRHRSLPKVVRLGQTFMHSSSRGTSGASSGAESSHSFGVRSCSRRIEWWSPFGRSSSPGIRPVRRMSVFALATSRSPCASPPINW